MSNKYERKDSRVNEKFDETINTEMILDFRFQAKSLDIPPYELGEKNKNSNVDRVFNNKEISASN
ncbi:hypothetical protein P7H25_00720 [Paenibacillus larvae]|nr:hypothetical protein [Paenibacillus larvae]MDT2254477.1 hypothetical protein [Paenibacillus larvae]